MGKAGENVHFMSVVISLLWLNDGLVYNVPKLGVEIEGKASNARENGRRKEDPRPHHDLIRPLKLHEKEKTVSISRVLSFF